MNECGHDRFDEDCNECWVRREWRGCDWLGYESMHAPKHGEPHDLTSLRGTYDWTATAHIMRQHKTYR